MVFLSEFTPEQLAFYEEQLKNGVFVSDNPLGNWHEWYLLERNQQILFQKIQKLAEIFSRAIPVEEPSVRGVEGGWKEWNTVSTNQRRLSVALDYLIAESKCFKTPKFSKIVHINVSLHGCTRICDIHVSLHGSSPIVGCGIGGSRNNQSQAGFTPERLAYYDEQLKKGIFVIPPTGLGNWQEWYILQRNQQILFQKIQKLAEVLSCTKPAQEILILGIEGGWKELATLTFNQKTLSDALDHLIKNLMQSVMS